MTDDPGYRPPRWAKPSPLGYAAAADAAHFVAGPLLAAAAVALSGVVAADEDKFRFPGVALLVLAVASVVLVASVQQGFHARALLYSAGDVATWWGEDAEARAELLRERQREHFERWRVKIGRAVAAYNVGVALLGVGVALCVAPPAGSPPHDAVLRWIGAGVVAMAAAGELIWAATAAHRSPRH